MLPPYCCGTKFRPRATGLRIKTIGSESNRDGFGAKVEITAEGSTRYAEVRAGSSFESSSDPRVHFGLGAATRVDAIVIHWPSGASRQAGTGAGRPGSRDPRGTRRQYRARCKVTENPTNILKLVVLGILIFCYS